MFRASVLGAETGVFLRKRAHVFALCFGNPFAQRGPSTLDERSGLHEPPKPTPGVIKRAFQHQIPRYIDWNSAISPIDAVLIGVCGDFREEEQQFSLKLRKWRRAFHASHLSNALSVLPWMVFAPLSSCKISKTALKLVQTGTGGASAVFCPETVFFADLLASFSG